MNGERACRRFRVLSLVAVLLFAQAPLAAPGAGAAADVDILGKRFGIGARTTRTDKDDTSFEDAVLARVEALLRRVDALRRSEPRTTKSKAAPRSAKYSPSQRDCRQPRSERRS